MSTSGLRVLIIGGYGAFGSRLARLLAGDPRFHLLVGGRSAEKAETFAAGLEGGAEGVVFDRDGDMQTQLALLKPAVAADLSGPFQEMGEDRYRVARAAIALGIDYIDVSDSREFVSGIDALDDEAKARGVFVLSGLSSFPALSFAAAEKLAIEFAEVHKVSSGIAPSAQATIGLNVIRAITSYAGKPVQVTRGGIPAESTGLAGGPGVVIAPPGCVPLRWRRFLLADTPDLSLLPQRFRHLQEAFTGAGTEPRWLQSLLTFAARLVRYRLLPSLAPFAPLIHAASRSLASGEARGGMFVRLEGLGHDRQALAATWHLVAEGDDGPFIPAMGAAVLLRALADGKRPGSGARAAIAELPLGAFEDGFRPLAIHTGIRRQRAGDRRLSLYQRVLGDEAWRTLPPAVAAMHALNDGELRVCGRARVERGSGLLAGLVAAIIGFPRAADDIPVSVTFKEKHGRETWTRNFGGRRFRSRQSEAAGRHAHLLAEDFGPVRVFIALVPEGERLRLIIRGWRIFGLPLPRFLAPDGNTFEEQRDGRFHFHVEIGGRLTGLIVRYTGWLEPDQPAMPSSSTSSASRN